MRRRILSVLTFFLMNTVLGGITELMLKNPVLLREVIPKDELTQKKQINSIGD